MVEYLNGEELEVYYKCGRSCKGASYLRLLLMLFVCFWSFGFPEPTGYFSAVCGFATPGFFILSGYFILAKDEEECEKKTIRKIKRSLKCFGFVFLLYLIINIVVCLIKKIHVVIRLRTVFNFVVLNLWPLPIGTNIWFIQSMLYAYIVIFIAVKLGLMKYYKPVMIVLFLFMLITGEFAGVVHFNILGYRYIPGNWLTRALPYILLGKFIREKIDAIHSLKPIVYLGLFAIGAGLTVGEIYLLGKTGNLIYIGHMIGHGVMAFSVCTLALYKRKGSTNLITYYDTSFSGMIYIFMEPIYYIIGLILGSGSMGFYSEYGGMVALAASLILAFLLNRSIIARWLFSNSYRRPKQPLPVELEGKK